MFVLGPVRRGGAAAFFGNFGLVGLPFLNCGADSECISWLMLRADMRPGPRSGRAGNSGDCSEVRGFVIVTFFATSATAAAAAASSSSSSEASNCNSMASVSFSLSCAAISWAFTGQHHGDVRSYEERPGNPCSSVPRASPVSCDHRRTHQSRPSESTTGAQAPSQRITDSMLALCALSATQTFGSVDKDAGMCPLSMSSTSFRWRTSARKRRAASRTCAM
mmetsp:Transcript_44362/g.105039  ORF Transcript_44362/g.105039 Transcript_44362/m.105039 type:complete len:221 (+) Transcript_44362:363-1025(+)